MDEYLDNPPDSRMWPEARQECHTCGKRGRFYCPDCLVFVGKPDEVDISLNLELPLEVDVVVTPEERRRSSGIQVAVVAPKSVRVVPFNHAENGLPAYDVRSDVVVFPSEGSACWPDFSPAELGAMRRLIFIDSRWANTRSVLHHPQLQGLRHVRISDPPSRSRFWRWHSEGEGHICTAEAIYAVLAEFAAASGAACRGGRLEDILFLFALMSSRIKDAYETDPSKTDQHLPSSEESKRRRRSRAVRLDRLVKTKYKGLEAVRDARGEEDAVEEFYRRRRGARPYRGKKSDGGVSPRANASPRHRSEGDSQSCVLDGRRGENLDWEKGARSEELA